MEQLAHVTTITAHPTNDSDMGADMPPAQTMTPTEAVAYLNADPRNALVIINVNAPPMLPNGQHIAVWRGAAETLTNFYYQELPLEEPDADGGEYDAETAIALALDALCS